MMTVVHLLARGGVIRRRQNGRLSQLLHLVALLLLNRLELLLLAISGFSALIERVSRIQLDHLRSGQVVADLLFAS